MELNSIPLVQIKKTNTHCTERVVEPDSIPSNFNSLYKFDSFHKNFEPNTPFHSFFSLISLFR